MSAKSGEHHKQSAAASPLAAAAAAQEDPFASLATSSSSFSAKNWLNSVLPKTDTENTAAQLSTRLQIHVQELSVSLEGQITQTLVRLPRTGMELERLTEGATTATARLGEIVELAGPVVESYPEPARDISRLQRNKQKLVRCSTMLASAKSLNQKISKLEKGIQAFGATTTDEHHSHHAASGGISVDTVEKLSSMISEVQESLQALRAVDPDYGKHLDAKIQSFEGELQRSTERQCLAQLKVHDKQSAPALLASLIRIGRADAVIAAFAESLIQDLIQPLLAEKKTLQQQQASSNKQQGATSATKVVATLIGFLRQCAKAIAKEHEYLDILFESSSSGAAAGDNLHLHSSSASMSSSKFRTSSSVEEHILEHVAKEIASIVHLVLATKVTTNTELLALYKIVPEVHRCNSSSSNSSSSASSSSAAAAAVVEAVFAPVCTDFVKREQQSVTQSLQQLLHSITTATAAAHPGSPSSTLDSLCEVLRGSEQRCLAFAPRLTLKAACAAWDEGLVSFFASASSSEANAAGSSSDRGGSADGSSSSSSSSSSAALRKALSLSQFLEQAKHRIVELDHEISAAVAPFFNTSSFNSAGSSSCSILSKTDETLTTCEADAKKRLHSVIEQPVVKCLVGYANQPAFTRSANSFGSKQQGGGEGASVPATSVGAFSAGLAAPSEAIRNSGEALMELPILFESAGMDISSDYGSSLLGRVVLSCVNSVITNASSVKLISSDALPQLLTDLDYFSNVLSAVSEVSYPELAAALAVLQEEEAAAKVEASLQQQSGNAHQQPILTVADLLK